MESLQGLSCSAISLNPEITLSAGLNNLNQPCLEQVVKCLSIYDLLKYEQELKERGIDTETVIYDCQWKLLMPVLDSHMASTVCPHLLDLSPRNGFNWGLSCALARIMLRNLVEHLHEFTPFGQNVFDYSTQKSVVETYDCSVNDELEDFETFDKHSLKSETENHENCCQPNEDRLEDKGINSDEVTYLDTDVDANVKSYSKSEFDLMDDAVLFGTTSPPSNLDNNGGFTKVDLKITNLVEISFCAAVLNHHLTHWLALKELHLGVPDLQPFTVQGIVCLLKRAQFASFTLSSANVTRKDMEDIINAVASFRFSHPLQRLMFVSVATAITSSYTATELPDLFDDASCSKDALSNMFPKLTECGRFQGTELLEIYCCGFDLWTEQLFIQFLRQNAALKTLCLGNNLMLSLGKSALRTLTLSDPSQSLNCLILEDWPINSLNCSIVRDLLRKMSHSLTSLCLKGCLIDKSEHVFSEIVMGVSACTNLQTLDLSGNYIGNYGAYFSGIFMKLAQLKELSLKGNRLPVHIVMSIMTELSESCKLSGARMKVVDMRGNKFVEDGQESCFNTEKYIRTLQRSFVDKVILDKEES
ncbi:hypothetical protein RRG08_002899 [Elysia crispata]|uniref:Uncharacterized protein n=1 Tax=Elysia crispata TaxID=231223 RepID=A0AAE1APC2_9GAST|nr:hypothetical protein RRG08_002899 [Elysia crispata]